MAPLLVLLGLKTGIIDTMRAQLLEDPRMREISSLGNRSLGDDEIRRLAEVPGLVLRRRPHKTIGRDGDPRPGRRQPGGGPPNWWRAPPATR